MPALSGISALWGYGLDEDGPAWLAARGWQPTVHPWPDVAASYDRCDEPARSILCGEAFVTAVRRPVRAAE